MAFQKVVLVVGVLVFVFCRDGHSQQPACGVATLNSRIIGGQTVMKGAWPWFAALNINGSLSCGGSLINNRWVLTAAHCISRLDLNVTMVHLGLQNTTGFNPNEVNRSLDDIVCHPEYDWYTKNNDICLLKLSSPVNFTSYIQPVCLAEANSTFYNGTSSWVTGFGNTDPSGDPADTLQEVNVPIIGQRECQCYLWPRNITRNMICAGAIYGGMDSCQGDSGGPMVSKTGSVYVQSGIVSWGEGCAQPMSPGVYTRVSRYQQWINDTVTGMRPGFVTFTSRGNNSDLNFTCPTTPPYPTYYPPNITHYPPNTTHHPPNITHYPPWFTTQYPPRPGPCDDPFSDNVFCAGENLVHFAHFVALSTLALVLHAFVG